MKRPSIVWHVLAAALLLLVGGWALLNSSLTFISNDVGLRFLQARELVANHWQTFAISYPAHFLDPDWEYTPYYYAYSIIDGALYFDISHWFPLALSFFYALWGAWGLSVTPMLGGVFTAVAIYKLGVLAQVRYPHLLFWATVLTTPLLIYSLELWDHSVAAACAAWSVYGVALGLMHSRWQPIAWGGVAAGIGLAQRPEMYVFAIALGLALVAGTWFQWRKWLAFIGGGLAITLPIWFFQVQWVGHPMGLSFAPHFFGYGRPTSYPVRPYSAITITRTFKISRFLLYVQGQDLLTFGAALAVVLGLFLLIFSLRIPALHRSRWLWGSVSLSALGYILYAFEAWGSLLPGLLTTFPLMAFALAFLDNAHDTSEARPVYLMTQLTSLVFLGLMFTIWPAYGGTQWGARYLLPVYPLLLLTAFYGVTGWEKSVARPFARTLRVVFFILLTIGFFIQMLSVRLLYKSHSEQIAIRDAVAELPADLILTNNPFFPSFMTSLESKLFMYVDSGDDIEILVSRMAEHDILRFALVTVEGMPLEVPGQVGNIHLKQVETLVYELSGAEP